jgi:predicted DNA-binding protein (UPF0251 family)
MSEGATRRSTSRSVGGAPQIAELHEFGTAFQQLLLQLPYDQRQAILLVDVYDYRYEEVAEITGDSLGTVKSRIHRGREKLRTMLAGRPELFGAVGRLEEEGVLMGFPGRLDATRGGKSSLMRTSMGN